ncbi:Hypothetical protein CINCED_3A015121, partial [Cinara cedri]
DLIRETPAPLEIQKPTDETPSPKDKDPLKESKIHELSQGYKGKGDEIIKHKIAIDKSLEDVTKSPSTDTIKSEFVDQKDDKTPTEMGATETKDDTFDKEITEPKRESVIEFEIGKGEKDIHKKLTDKIKSPDDKQLHFDHGEEITTIITKVTETNKTKLQQTDSDLIRETPAPLEIQKPTDETPSPKDNDPSKESNIHEHSQGYKGEGDEIIKHKIPTDKSLEDVTKSPSTDTIKSEFVDKKDVKTPTELGGTEAKDDTLDIEITDLKKETMIEIEKIKGDKEIQKKLTDKIKSPDDKQLHFDHGEEITTIITKVTETNKTKLQQTDSDLIRETPAPLEIQKPTDETPSPKDKDPLKESKIHELSQGYKGKGDEIIKHKIAIDKSLEDVTKSPSTDTIKSEFVDQKDDKTPTEMGATETKDDTFDKEITEPKRETRESVIEFEIGKGEKDIHKKLTDKIKSPDDKQLHFDHGEEITTIITKVTETNKTKLQQTDSDLIRETPAPLEIQKPTDETSSPKDKDPLKESKIHELSQGAKEEGDEIIKHKIPIDKSLEDVTKSPSPDTIKSEFVDKKDDKTPTELGGTEAKDDTLDIEITDLKKETMIEIEKIKGDKEIQKKLTDKIKSPDDKQLHFDHGEETITIVTQVTETHVTKLKETDGDLIGETPTTSEIQKPTDETPSPRDKVPLKESKIHELSQGYKGKGDEIIKHKIAIDKSLEDVTKSPSTDTIKSEFVDQKEVKTPTEMGATETKDDTFDKEITELKRETVIEFEIGKGDKDIHQKLTDKIKSPDDKQLHFDHGEETITIVTQVTETHVTKLKETD